MLSSLNAVRGYALGASDGAIGEVEDAFFDDATWTVRYLVVRTGGWLFGRKVLIAPAALGEPDADRREFPAALTREQVKESPDIDADRPVNRQMETSLYSHYGWAPYWELGAPAPGVGVFPGGALGAEPYVPPPPPTDESAEAAREPRGDPHLRSGRDVEGYHIAASDGEIGHVEDFLLDLRAWAVRYLLVDTRNWLPGRRVLVAPAWVRSIDWAERRVHVDLSRERVRAAPEYDPTRPLEREDEARLHSHYGRAPYW